MLGVIGILRAMLNLRVPPDFQTLRDYALPRLDLHDPVTTARKLQDLRLAIGEILHPLICFLLYKNRIKDCVKLGKYCNNFILRICNTMIFHKIVKV